MTFTVTITVRVIVIKLQYNNNNITVRFYHFDSTCTMQGIDLLEEIQEKEQLEPYLVLVQEDNDIFLIVDKNIVDKVEPQDIPFALMAAFYVFNIHYPKGCHVLYAFLEVLALTFTPEKAPASVKHLFANLAAHAE